MPEFTGNKIPRATEEDYIEIQGGKPSVKKEGGLVIVTHDYEGGSGMVVKSHIDYGTVNLTTQSGTKNFRVELLEEFHGGPCEKQSQIAGGGRYPRKK